MRYRATLFQIAVRDFGGIDEICCYFVWYLQRFQAKYQQPCP